MVAPIEPEAIPTPDLQASWLQSAASWLRADAGRIWSAGVNIRANWQGLAAVYSAPEAGQLLAVMDPVRTFADSFADTVEAAARALDRFAQEAGPLASQLQSIQADARAFRRRLLSVEHWDHHSDLVEENNSYLWAVDRAVVAFEQAERDCANAIERLIGIAPFHPDGDPTTDPKSYGVSSIPRNSATLWGTPAKTRKSFLGSAEGALSVFNPVEGWDAKLDVARGQWSALVGMGEGLAALTPVLGWDPFTQTWDGIGTLGGLHGPLPALAADWSMIKSTVDWDEWAVDPNRASGTSVINTMSLAIPFAGEASALADVSRAGRAAELADNTARAAKGAATIAAAARIEEFARLTRLGDGVDPNLISRMHRVGDLDSMVEDKFGDLTTADSPANALQTEMAGQPVSGATSIPASETREKAPQTASSQGSAGSSGPPHDGGAARSGSAPPSEEPPPPLFHNLSPEDEIRSANVVPVAALRSLRGTYPYVVTEDGELLVGKWGWSREPIGHIDLAGGAPVTAAGEAFFLDGTVRSFNNLSGHYRPTGSSIEGVAQDAFERAGLVIRAGAYKGVG
jgi:hypothetical protein